MALIEAGQRVEARTQPRASRLRRFFPLGLALLDIALIYLAFVLAYWVRYSLKIGPLIRDQLTFAAYWPIALLVLSIMIPVLFLKGMYRTRMSTEIVDEAGAVFSAATITVASIVVITAMAQRYQYSRGVIVYLWVLLIVALFVGRVLYRSLQRVLFRLGWGARRLLVVGATDVGKMVMQRVMSRPDLGYQLVGFVDHRPTAQVHDFGRFRALGTVRDIPDLIESNGVDEVIVALPASAHAEVWSVLSLCEREGVGLKLVPDLFEMSLSRVEVDDIAGIPLFDVREKPAQRFARAGKRCLDVAVCLVAAPLCLVFMGVLAAMIRMESPGSPFLWQERVGLNGHRFRCLKLRTMRDRAEEMRDDLTPFNEATGPLFKLRNDPRCTPLGRRMRRWSLDELPQLWNVLKGDMSLVGPRPPLPSEVAQYSALHMRRLESKPGMTGIWQVSGRSDLPFDEMVMMDIYYIDRWSFMLDLRILVRTIIAVLGRHGAY